MIPERQKDPIGYARFWMGDLFPLLHKRAEDMRLAIKSSDVSQTSRNGLKRLNSLAARQLLRRLPIKENGTYIFIPVEFLAEYFQSGIRK